MPISPALPRSIVIFRVSSNFAAVLLRNLVAPAPTGSNIIGIPFLFAAFPIDQCYVSFFR